MTAKKVAILTVFGPEWMCFGAKVRINEFSDLLLFCVAAPKHLSNKSSDDKVS